MDKNNLKVVLIAQTGVGKSQLGNFILQNECFKIGHSKNSETKILSEGYSHLDGMNVTIVDTPGLNDTGSKDEEIMNLIVKKFQEDNSIDGIILVYSFRDPRRVQKHRELVNNLIKLFGKDLLEKRLKVIFTNSTVGEERDEEEEKKERIQMNDTKEFLNHIVTDNEMIFINSKKIFYNKFRSKIVELLNQIYDIKNKYGSINNALIKKKELEFIEKENQKEKERMEKELKKREKEKKDNLEKKLKEIDDSINYYQSKISETEDKIQYLKGQISVDTAYTVWCSITAPLSFGISAIGAGIFSYDKKKMQKQKEEYEKDLEYYRTEITKLRAKEETLKLALI